MAERIFCVIEMKEIQLTTKLIYMLEFQDAITITCGTGAFEGASGELITDSYVDADRTDHVWSGEITIIQ